MEVFGLVFVVAVAAVVAVGAAALWRFSTLRNTGSQGLMRRLPAEDVHGWRHGVFRYSEEQLKFYKLRSLSFTCDAAVNRRGSSIEGFRELSAAEREFIPGVDRVVVLSTGAARYELASDSRAQMALVSWIESAPSTRSVRSDAKGAQPRAAQRRVHRP
ncbi:DUF2550 domain-containing protein [Corynebacterium liangguodongii]|nr:DUF2550 domain-containing protein [Corynebacterium liangguodongii]